MRGRRREIPRGTLNKSAWTAASRRSRNSATCYRRLSAQRERQRLSCTAWPRLNRGSERGSRSRSRLGKTQRSSNNGKYEDEQMNNRDPSERPSLEPYLQMQIFRHNFSKAKNSLLERDNHLNEGLGDLRASGENL